MDPFQQKVFYLLVWRAWLATLAAVVLMATRSFDLAIALLIGANVALLFSLSLILWAGRLTDDDVARTEAWRLLRPDQWPAGPAGRRWARNCVNEAALRFAKCASAVAAIFSAAALVLVGA